MNIAIVGTGYVGLVSGTCFADTGANVTCVDVDANKIERLKKSEIPIYEPGLDELVKKNVAAGRLKFTTDLASVLDDVEIVFSAREWLYDDNIFISFSETTVLRVYSFPVFFNLSFAVSKVILRSFNKLPNLIFIRL